MEEFLSAEGVRLSPEFELPTSEMLIQFAVRNLGIASVVEDFAAERIRSGELCLLRFEREIPVRRLCIVTDERIPVSRAAGKLLDFLIDEKPSGEDETV